jgi:hypothetical protein
VRPRPRAAAAQPCFGVLARPSAGPDRLHPPLHRQCRKLHCSLIGSTCDLPFDEGQTCYEYSKLPPERQLSVFPGDGWDGNVSYWRGYLEAPRREGIFKDVFNGRLDLGHVPDRRVWLPLEACNASCSYHGSCLRDKWHNDQPHCACYHVRCCGTTVH